MPEEEFVSEGRVRCPIAPTPQRLVQRCDFYEGFKYNVNSFGRQLGPLADAALLSGWKRSAAEIAISTQNKRMMFLGQLREALKLKAPWSNPAKDPTVGGG